MNFNFLLAVIGCISAQSLRFELGGEALADGQTIYCIDFNEDFGEFLQELQIRNMSGTDLDVVVEKEIITVPDGSSNYFCWGMCFDPSVYVSRAVPLPAGTVSGEGELSFHFIPVTMTDFASIKYYAYDEGSNERISVVVVFNSLEGVGDHSTACSLSHAYPNPASTVVRFDYGLSPSDRAVLSIYNLLGQEVMSQELNGIQGQASISVADLTEGIYFCNLMVNGQAVKTEKFIVKK